MLTEPTPLVPSSRGRRIRLAVGLLVPTVLLVAAVSIGVLGPHPAEQHAAVIAPPAAEASASAAETGSATATFPPTALDLPVLGVGGARFGLIDLPTAPIAVAGDLTITTSTDCPAPVSDPLATAVARELGVNSSADTFCERRAVLAPPEPTRPGSRSQAPPLALMIRPGTVVPGSADVSGGPPMRVVVVGHAAPLAASTSATGGPVGPALVVDRVVWANGLWRAPITSVDPLLLLDGPRLAWRIRDRLAADAVGPGETLLRETLLPPDALTTVDPAAADRSLFDGALPSRTWYRVSIVDRGAGRRVAWVAIDDVRGRLVGHGDVP